ncbi:MAG: outer membrane lipoprotein-sorting protein [Alphaproteobacteria bacterium]|nr:outer membrane lipoprotein-sorting protein [Alphaproteobacteria bacterium]
MRPADLLRRVALLAALALPLAGLALDPDSDDPRAIVTAVEQREVGRSQASRMRITVKDKAGRERVRELDSRSLRVEGASKQMMVFTAPADMRGAGVLTVDYDAVGEPDAQWIYLPSVGQSTRLAPADRSGSFMGTDLSYADMTRKDPDQYDFEMLDQEVVVDGERCWRVEARARTEAERKDTGVLRTQLWISKDKGVTLRTKAWVIEGQRLKYTQASDLREVDGHWVPFTLTVRTVRDGELESESVLQLLSLELDRADVTDALFTTQRLEQGL